MNSEWSKTAGERFCPILLHAVLITPHMDATEWGVCKAGECMMWVVDDDDRDLGHCGLCHNWAKCEMVESDISEYQ